MVGGGSTPAPCEISLAHHCVKCRSKVKPNSFCLCVRPRSPAHRLCVRPRSSATQDLRWPPSTASSMPPGQIMLMRRSGDRRSTVPSGRTSGCRTYRHAFSCCVMQFTNHSTSSRNDGTSRVLSNSILADSTLARRIVLMKAQIT